MTDELLFKNIYSKILDYSDSEFSDSLSKWGYSVYKQLEKDGAILITGGAETQTPFIYAITTAVIVGELSKIAFNDFFDNETKINFLELEIPFEQLRGFLNADIADEQIERISKSGCINLQDIWESIIDYKTHIYEQLVLKYGGKENDADHSIYMSLIKIHRGDVIGETLGSNSMAGYQYVSSGFQY